MKNVLLGIILTCISWTVFCQEHTTMGRDFWISYLYFTYDYYAPQYTVTLHAFASGPRPCSVNVTNPNTAWSTSFYITPGQVTNITIPFDEGCTSSSGSITPTALHVTATDSISLYLIMLGHNNLDITNALPTNLLGSDYMVQCYPSKSSTDYRSEIVIVATEDSTLVDFTVTAPTMNGFAAGTNHTITLQKGDAYQIRGATNVSEADLTGTTIHARDCKKIAVHAGHFCAYVPNNASTCDHIFDQCLPTNYWGKRFIVAGTGTLFDDRIRVMPLQNNCQIHKNNEYVTTIQAGQIYDFPLSASDRLAYIETSVPSCVYLFMGSAGTQDGDPSMVVINPVDQNVHQITFATYSTSYTNTHFLNIIAPASEFNQLRLDGSPVNSTPISVNNNFRTAKIQLAQGSHTLSTPAAGGFQAYAYGIGYHESYAYSVGSSLKVVHSALLTINDVNVSDNDTIYLCQGDTLKATTKVDNINHPCDWTFDDRPYGYLDTLNIVMTDTGRFQITSHSQDTIYTVCDTFSYEYNFTATIIVVPTYITHKHDTITADQLPWRFHGIYYDSVSNDTIRLRSQYNCDSLIIYSLTLYEDTIYTDLYDTICIGTSYFRNGFHIDSTETTRVGEVVYTRRESNHVTYLHLYQSDSPQVTIAYNYYGDSCYSMTAVTDADLIVWSATPPDSSLNGQERQSTITVCPRIPTEYQVTIGYSSIPNCTTQKSVSLHNRIELPEGYLWVPNVFTPEESTNNRFKAIGIGIKEFEIYIFHRWGTKAFHSTDINEAWDGTTKTGKCPSATYTYLIYYTTVYNPNMRKKVSGTITLIR